jgi:prepilin-type N-terminal cleavage/methylation domain-containing protein
MNAFPGRASQSQQGYTAVELMLVVGIMGVVMSIAMFQIGAARPAFKGDAAMRTIMAQLNTARELSISQRRQMQVNFIAPSTVQIVRQEVPAGTTTTLSTVPIEGGLSFGLIAGVGDTPDLFGISGGTTGIAFGTATQILFSSDGTVIDQAGNPLNGTVFMAIPASARSFRAITVFGGTGRIRGFKWDGRQWVLA